jgi:hypothetical protein
MNQQTPEWTIDHSAVMTDCKIDRRALKFSNRLTDCNRALETLIFTK